MNCATEVSQLRKAGRLDDALKRARTCFAAEPDDIFAQRAFGWVIHDLVKQEVQQFGQKKVPPGRVANRFNELLADYRLFGANDRPGMLHSFLLNQVLKGSRVWPGFLEFAQWWGPEYFRPEDRDPYTAENGKNLPSLTMRYFYAIGRESSHLASHLNGDLLAWGEAQVDGALVDAPNDQWLHYFKSKFLLYKGSGAEARECLMPVVRRQQRAAWVWTLLGQTYESSEPTQAITCYFRAVQVAGKAQDVANTRISLARLLAADSRFEEAAVQVQHALKYRQSGNFAVPQPLAQMVRSDWYRTLATRKDLPREPDVSDEADAVLFSGEERELEYRLGVVDNHNAAKSLAHVAFALDEGFVLPYRRFRGISDVQLGDLVEVGFNSGDRKAVRWREASATDIPDFFKSMSGELIQRSGQSFRFVVTEHGERIFVHPDLLVPMSGAVGTRVRCRAVMSKDKQGRPGWRALRLRSYP